MPVFQRNVRAARAVQRILAVSVGLLLVGFSAHGYAQSRVYSDLPGGAAPEAGSLPPGAVTLEQFDQRTQGATVAPPEAAPVKPVAPLASTPPPATPAATTPAPAPVASSGPALSDTRSEPVNWNFAPADARGTSKTAAPTAVSATAAAPTNVQTRSDLPAGMAAGATVPAGAMTLEQYDQIMRNPSSAPNQHLSVQPAAQPSGNVLVEEDTYKQQRVKPNDSGPPHQRWN